MTMETDPFGDRLVALCVVAMVVIIVGHFMFKYW